MKFYNRIRPWVCKWSNSLQDISVGPTVSDYRNFLAISVPFPCHLLSSSSATAETASPLVITSVEKRAVMADSSLNSPRRTLSLSKERVTVSLLDSDESAAAFFLSEEHGLKPSEVYGFVGSISTIVTTAIFLAWAYIPECWLHYLGITYYPSRYWALAVPAYAMVIVFLAIGFYLGLNFMVTPPPTSFNTIYDECSRERSTFVAAAEGANQPIEPIADIAISHINGLMFGQTM